MSQQYYQKLWNETQKDVKKTLEVDEKIRKKAPYKDQNAAKWLIGHLYMGYARIANRLDECYDQMIHPQKREVIGRLLDLCLGRLLELKSEIVRIECDDYCFFDNILIELKLTHDDVEIHVPKYYWRDRREAASHRGELMRKVYDELERERFKEEYLRNFPPEERDQAWEKYLQEEQKKEKQRLEQQQRLMLSEKLESKLDKGKKLSLRERKVSLIDRASRIQDFTPEQNRLLMTQGLLKTLMERQKEQPREKYFWEKMPMEDVDSAATVIQRHWRRHWKRLQEIKGKKHLQKLWGMTPEDTRNSDLYKVLNEMKEKFRKAQDENQELYEKAKLKMKEKLTALYSIPIEEDTVDELIGWFKYYYDESDYLPDFPPEKEIIPKGDILGIPKKLGKDFIERVFQQGKKKPGEKGQKLTPLGISLAGLFAIGGSALVVSGHWIDAKDYLRCMMELEKRKAGGGGKEKPDKKKEKEELEKKKKAAEEAEGFLLKPSNYLVGLSKADRDYRVMWMDRDESNNPQQRHIPELIKEDQMWTLSLEIRKQVDKMMEMELELLKDALQRDKNPRKKRKRKKKPRRKERKKKQKKDPTAHRTLDDLFIELFRNGIIKDYEQAFLSEFIGERSFAAFDLRQRLIDWPPSTGDVRDLILQLCIIPLGSSRIHQLSPIIRSVCLVGTENCGKEFLARIICTETAAVMFDLSPANVSGKYPGKDGLKMLQHLVQKMSRALQPSVIFVDGAEKMFYKKVPKEEKSLDPRRLGRMVTKIVKEIKPEDQVLVLGISSRPWMARKRKLLKAYQKIIQIPQMDYGSYMWLWSVLLKSYNLLEDEFDVSCLAKVSNGFSTKDIVEVVRVVLTKKRFSGQLSHTFTQEEFLDELLKYKMTDPKIKQKILKFCSGLQLPKLRAKKLADDRAEMNKAQRRAG